MSDLVASLSRLGLSEEEARVVAAMREARGAPPAAAPRWRDGAVAFGLAALAALAIKAPEVSGRFLDTHPEFYARNVALFVLPLLAGYFAWRRRVARRRVLAIGAAFALAALVVNLPGFLHGDLVGLAALHLPIALWLAVAVAHAGGRWRDAGARMDFVRFTGETVIHYALIALGGIVLCGLTFMLFEAAGRDAEPFFERWMLPCGAIGAVIVAAWWVDASRAARLAPMLVRLFTPLFTLLLLAFLAMVATSGRALAFHRELLIGFDLLLVVVLGLLVHAIAARDPDAVPGVFDHLQLVLLIAALLVDGFALGSIGARIGELGSTPNRLAALGMNLVLLVNLAVSAWLQARWLSGRGGFAALVGWQARYVTVYAAWAAAVVAGFPLLFG